KVKKHLVRFSSKSCKEILQSLAAQLKTGVENDEFSDFQMFSREFQNLLNKYKEKAKGPSKESVLGIFMETELPILFNRFYSNKERLLKQKIQKIESKYLLEKEEYYKKLEDAYSKRDNLQDKINQQEKLVRQIKEELNSKLHDHQKVKSSLKESEEKRKKLKAEIHKLKQEIEEKQKRIEDLNNRIESQESCFNEKLDDKERKINELQ